LSSFTPFFHATQTLEIPRRIHIERHAAVLAPINFGKRLQVNHFQVASHVYLAVLAQHLVAILRVKVATALITLPRLLPSQRAARLMAADAVDPQFLAMLTTLAHDSSPQ
jgi:hypothetical protein